MKLVKAFATAGTLALCNLVSGVAFGKDAPRSDAVISYPASFDVDTPQFLHFLTIAGRKPIGHSEFCQRLPFECAFKADHFDVVRESMIPEVIRAHQETMRTIAQQTDWDIYKVNEFWTYPVDEGDCEDIGLYNMRALEAIGIPRSAMFMVMVDRDPSDKMEGHAFLVVRTAKGDLALDNYNYAGTVQYAVDLNYEYIRAQDMTDYAVWHDIVAFQPQKPATTASLGL